MPSRTTQSGEYILQFHFSLNVFYLILFIGHGFINYVFKTELYRHDPLHISFDPSSCYMTT